MFKKVKIGPYLYSIRHVDHIENDEGNPDGLWSFDTKVGGMIQMRKDIEDDTVQAEVLTHEILHALFHHFGMELDNEEYLVSNIAVGLIMVMKDNPKYLAYLTEKLK